MRYRLRKCYFLFIFVQIQSKKKIKVLNHLEIWQQISFSQIVCECELTKTHFHNLFIAARVKCIPLSINFICTLVCHKFFKNNSVWSIHNVYLWDISYQMKSVNRYSFFHTISTIFMNITTYDALYNNYEVIYPQLK